MSKTFSSLYFWRPILWKGRHRKCLLEEIDLSDFCMDFPLLFKTKPKFVEEACCWEAPICEDDSRDRDSTVALISETCWKTLLNKRTPFWVSRSGLCSWKDQNRRWHGQKLHAEFSQLVISQNVEVISVKTVIFLGQFEFFTAGIIQSELTQRSGTHFHSYETLMNHSHSITEQKAKSNYTRRKHFHYRRSEKYWKIDCWKLKGLCFCKIF